MSSRDKPFFLQVTDLVGRSGTHRDETLTGALAITLELARVEEPITAEVRLESLPHEILARGTVTFTATLSCNRCLTEWVHEDRASFAQLFAPEPDEDGRAITRDGHIDLEPVLRDEVGLALPLVPLCKGDCRGLCPTCGTDLNTAPCSGHVEEEESPFGVLRQLLEP